MALHRSHPSPQFVLPVGATELPAPFITHSTLIDVTVCEWTADLHAATPALATPAATSVGATGYVDFDTVESIHETVGNVAQAQR